MAYRSQGPDSSSSSNVQVRTNHYKITALPEIAIQQWSVDFHTSGRVPTGKQALLDRNLRLWKSDIVQEAIKGAKVIYNGGGIAWSARPLGFTSLEKTIVGKPHECILSMKETAIISLRTLQSFLEGRIAKDESIQSAITFLDALLRETPAQRFPTLLGKNSYFDSTLRENVYELRSGAQLWRGVFQSARPAPGYMNIVVDVAHTAFYRPDISIVDLLVENLQLSSADAIRSLRDDRRKRIEANRLVSSLGVYTRHTERRDRGVRLEKIYSIAWKDTAETYRFQVGETECSVKEHFKNHYNIALRYPDFPLLEMNGGKSRLPLELCYVAVGQKFPNALLSSYQTAEIVKRAAQPPMERQQSIAANVRTLDWSGDRTLTEFGLQVSTESIMADAKVLVPPTLVYANSHTLQPHDGKWNASGRRFCHSNKLESWGILKFVNDDSGQFESEFVRSGAKCGVDIVARTPYRQRGNEEANMEKLVQDFYRATGNHFQKRPQVLFFIIFGKSSSLYGEIKRVCDTIIGVPSQCIASVNLRKANGQYCDNVWLKVNPKTGGLNNRLKQVMLPPRTLMIGADVSHPPPAVRGDSAMSIAALVSNQDLDVSSFVAQARAQTARVDCIEDMEVLVRNAIELYNRYTKEMPNAIMYYRDGVADTQFDTVRSQELPAIRKACDIHGINPKITIVICQKRHHTRLFARDPRSGDRNGNVKPGTCVDSHITNPSNFNFFLVAHTSFKGTARPTHYQLIHDENNFRPEDLEALTYDLCHTFSRSNTSVSLVPVAYYAHLVGGRVKNYCASGSETGSSNGEGRGLEPLPRLHDNLRKLAWYL